MTLSAALLCASDVATHPLRVARAVRGLSQRELEKLAGLPATTLSRVENGGRELDPASQLRVAMALDADVDALFPQT